jgi:hypothetical protein
VHGHIGICVLVVTIEAIIVADLRHGDVRDPDKPGQVLGARHALRELGRVRLERIEVGAQTIELVTCRTPLQRQILVALAVNTSS